MSGLEYAIHDLVVPLRGIVCPRLLRRPASADFYSTAADISSDHTNLRAGWGGDGVHAVCD